MVQEGLGRLQEKNLDADGYCQLSMLHEKLGHSAEAKKCLNTALKLLLPAEKGGELAWTIIASSPSSTRGSATWRRQRSPLRAH